MGRNNEGNIKPCYTCGSFYTSYRWYRNNEVDGTFNCTQCHFNIQNKQTAVKRLGCVSPMKGKKHSDESRRKISLALTGRPNPRKGKRLACSAWNKGKPWSPEMLAKLKIAHKGQKSSFKGKHHTPEAKKKLSDALKGKPATRKDKSIKPEVRLKISNTLKTLPPPSNETRMKLRLGQIRRYDKLGPRRTGLRRAIRRMAKYKEWQKAIFIRDDYTCQICNKRGSRIIHAHHIFKFAWILKEFNIKTTDDAFNCDLLWDIDNGITYCDQCHKKVEKAARLKL